MGRLSIMQRSTDSYVRFQPPPTAVLQTQTVAVGRLRIVLIVARGFHSREPGTKSGGASSKPSNSNAGETVQLTRVNSPVLRADCQ